MPLAILRELQGMGDEFDHSMGESDGSDGSDGGSDGGDPPDLPTILHEGERRWVHVPQGTTKPNAMKRFEEETGITDEVDLTTTKSVFDFFSLFFTLEFVGSLVDRTNAYAERRGANAQPAEPAQPAQPAQPAKAAEPAQPAEPAQLTQPNPAKKSKAKPWHPTTPTEMIKFLSLIFIMGLIRKPLVNVWLENLNKKCGCHH